jgi:hypothetical protein
LKQEDSEEGKNASSETKKGQTRRSAPRDYLFFAAFFAAFLGAFFTAFFAAFFVAMLLILPSSIM